jgi:large subunit ribosomal protein L23
MPTITETIVTPIVTEQTSTSYQDRGEYTFRVHPKATKTQIRTAIEELFNVTVTGVWTSLKEGDSIEIFEGA